MNLTSSDSPEPRRQGFLDSLSSVAVIAAAIAIVWTSVFPRSSTTPLAEARAPQPAGRPQPRLPEEPVPLAGAAILGSSNAPVAIIEYSEFQCPFCARFVRDTQPELDKKYIRPGKVLLAFRHFPLPTHSFAGKAAEAAECAGQQGKFWGLHDRLFDDQKQLGLESVRSAAVGLGLVMQKFDQCFEGEMKAKIEADRVSGTKLGVSGTPNFLIGTTVGDGRVKVRHRITGAQPLASFQVVLERLLEEVSTGSR
jgi:protein-disulfide isomerase